MTMASPTTSAREWDLFADWCHAHQRRALPTNVETVTEFACSVTGAESTIKHRLWSIAKVHQRAGFDLELPRPGPPVAWRTGDEWPTAGKVLSRIPVRGWTHGYRGRRDAVLVVAIGVLRLSRRETTGLTGADVTFDGHDFYLAGRFVPRCQASGSCPACAVARWLPLLAAVESWSRADAQRIIMAPNGATAGDCTEHCCQPTSGFNWPQHVPLLPNIDRYGYAGDPLTPRTVSALLSREQTRTFNGAPADGAHTRRSPSGGQGRFSNYSMDDLVDALDDLDDAADQAARESSEVLNVAMTMATYMASLRSTGRPASAAPGAGFRT